MEGGGFGDDAEVELLTCPSSLLFDEGIKKAEATDCRKIV